MFIGEAPGAEEERSGRPFVGPSGRLLNCLIEYYTNLRRTTVYVTNVVKHRPPDNATPKVGQIKPYLPTLWDEIQAVQPKVIVAVGAIAAHVFDKKLKMKEAHGIAHSCTIPDVWEGILVPWWHTSYALQSPSIFKEAAADAARLHDEVARFDAPPLKLDYRLATEAEVVRQLLQHWAPFGFDTETTSPHRGGVFQTDEAEMVGYSVSWAPGQGVYVPTQSVGPGMAAILESPIWGKVCHNAKFELKVLRKQGIEMRNYEDTKLAAYLLGESQTGLKVLATRHLGASPISYADVTGGHDMSALPPEDVAEYASMDADHTLRLWEGVYQRRLLDEELEPLYSGMERPLIPVLADMEAHGLLVDDALEGACVEVKLKLDDASDTARRETLAAFDDIGVNVLDFNINSPDQVAEALDALGAPLKKRTKTGRHVVDVHVLEEIRDWWPEGIGAILRYRKYGTMLKFVHAFWQLRDSNARIHTSFNQAGHYEETGETGSAPSTGRVSSSGPNFQNIPHHRARIGDTDWGHELRRCIVAPLGSTLLSADLGQEEPRIVAVMAQDQTLLEGFANDRDIYRPATEALYPYTVSPEEDDRTWKRKWDAWERYNGKQFFLAWYYGAGASRLKALDPSLSSLDVRRGLDLLDAAHPARAAYLQGTWEELNRTGYVTSLYGRKRWISQVWSNRKSEREEALRMAANMKVQGTAADILKYALPRIHSGFARRKMQSRLVSTVHDEVICEVPNDEVTLAAQVVAESFQGLLPGVNLILETYIGQRWADRERLT